MKSKSKMTTQDKAIIAAHNASDNGLKLGTAKSEIKGNSELPLFNNVKQTELKL
jgi:hypothetical protein